MTTGNRAALDVLLTDAAAGGRPGLPLAADRRGAHRRPHETP